MPQGCCYARLYVLYLSCTQILITNQTDYGHKLFPSRRRSRNNANGRSSHWASADCVHAACKCMKHEAGPTYLSPVQAS